jgi:hypothetical protein
LSEKTSQGSNGILTGIVTWIISRSGGRIILSDSLLEGIGERDFLPLSKMSGNVGLGLVATKQEVIPWSN